MNQAPKTIGTETLVDFFGCDDSITQMGGQDRLKILMTS